MELIISQWTKSMAFFKISDFEEQLVNGLPPFLFIKVVTRIESIRPIELSTKLIKTKSATLINKKGGKSLAPPAEWPSHWRQKAFDDQRS